MLHLVSDTLSMLSCSTLRNSLMAPTLGSEIVSRMSSCKWLRFSSRKDFECGLLIGHTATFNHEHHNWDILTSPVPWFPMLRNITPPHIHCEDAIVRMAEKIRANLSLPIYTDLFDHPTVCLLSRHLLWAHLFCPDFSVVSMWFEEWSAADVSNHSLITGPTMCVPSLDLPHLLMCPSEPISNGPG